jgi:hypothetical protein
MSEVRVSGVIPASVGEVWAVVGDFGGIAGWVPALAKSELAPGATGSQVGDVRSCTIDGGPDLVESQTARSDADYTYTYDITENPLPMNNYVSTIRLRVHGEHTMMEWTASFDPTGPEHEVTGMVKGLYQSALDNLYQRFGG